VSKLARGPLILYVPGLKTKPEHTLHLEQIRRCMLEGVRRIDPRAAAEMEQDEHCLDLVNWTYDFYGSHRDLRLDLDDIEAVLVKSGPTTEDLRLVTSWRRRLLRALYRAADRLPFLIPSIANEDVALQLRDLRHYTHNENDIANVVRSRLKISLLAAASAGRPVLLFGHSMGSVICYDTLWQLTHHSTEAVSIDLFLTTGSPLGQKVIEQRLQGFGKEGAARFPGNIRRWSNVAAVGELTAIDMTLANDFGAMVDLGLVDYIEDLACWNYYHMNGVLNVHTEYGYLVNEVTAGVIRDWWRAVTG
jgi:pimeloyl-ACP methyl ester carboxylesterase